MCRHLAYLGPPVDLAGLLLDPPHSLLRQSFAPRDMRGGGTINADGFGIGWYTPVGPVRYRRECPMWSDSNVTELARVTTAGALLAAVRSATPGLAMGEAACAPFAGEEWLFSHNGVVSGWPASVAGLAGALPTVDLLTLPALTDSALLWAMLRHRLRAGTDPAEAVAATAVEVSAAAPGSRLNLLLTDGRRVYATTVGHSLAVHHIPGRLVVASEPYDDDSGWEPIADRRLVVADRSTWTQEAL